MGSVSFRKLRVAGSQIDFITQRYGYDSVERLSQIKYVKAEGTAAEQLIEQIDYGYDAMGQRTSRTTLNGNGTGASETPMTASYDAANRMTGVTLSIAGTTKTYALSYDPNGNLTQKANASDSNDKTLYSWDANDRLTNITQPDLNASFSYDAFGRRIQATITKTGQAAATVQYLYEGAQALGEIRDAKLSQRLLTGLSLDETIARIAINTSGQKDSTNSRIYMTDALNSVIAQLNDDGNANIANSYGYSPYGEAISVGPDAANNPNQYTSRENDGTGLMFYRARYYDPVLKRFVSEDPTGTAAGPNFFAYAKSAPISEVDPLGLWSTEVHNQIIQEMFGGALSSQAIALIQQGSASVDSPWNQVFGDDAFHAMRGSRDSIADAKKRACAFIRSNMGDYRNNMNTKNWQDAYRSLGMALHPIMDSTSPPHAGWPVWHLWDSYKHGGLFSTSQENAIDITQMQRTIDLIKRAMSGDECACTE